MARDYSACQYAVLGLKFGLDGGITTLLAEDKAMAKSLSNSIREDHDAVIIYKIHKVVKP